MRNKEDGVFVQTIDLLDIIAVCYPPRKNESQYSYKAPHILKLVSSSYICYVTHSNRSNTQDLQKKTILRITHPLVNSIFVSFWNEGTLHLLYYIPRSLDFFLP
jgi:hypothetical protein